MAVRVNQLHSAILSARARIGCVNGINLELVNKQRFSGIERVYGSAGLDAFKSAHVCIIGLGGVGSWAVEALTRSAIGYLTLIDLDNVAVSNINRQIQALDVTIGMPKTSALHERIKSINPQCRVREIEDFISTENIPELISGSFDYVIDCTDDFRVKAALCAYCRYHKFKLLVIGGAGGQTQPGKIMIADLSRTEHDSLLTQTRRLLRKNYRFPRNLKRRFDIPCVYSLEQAVYPARDGQLTSDKSQSASTTGLNCAQGLGSAVTVTASFGMFAAAHVLNKIALTT